MQNQVFGQQHRKLSRIPALDGDEQADTRARVVEQALTWVGTKFRHQGRAKQTETWHGGVDCIGLVIGIARELGLDKQIEFDDVKGYGRQPDGDMMERTMRQYMKPIRINQALPGDVLHMALMKYPQHVAIVMPNNCIVHADGNLGRVVHHRLDSDWMTTVRGAYRLKGIIS